MVKALKHIEKDLYHDSKGLANNVHVANKAGDFHLGNDDFIVAATPL
ncbi:hypothetical protein [Bacillus sp. ISL-37]|jgi:hypothetical protein|nr:hypothetical protein [Bacillus sp. ISL-37]